MKNYITILYIVAKKVTSWKKYLGKKYKRKRQVANMQSQDPKLGDKLLTITIQAHISMIRCLKTTYKHPPLKEVTLQLRKLMT